RRACCERTCDRLPGRHEDAWPGDEPEDPERGEVRVLTRAERPGRDGEEPEGGHPGDEHADGDRHRSFGKGGEDAVQLAVGDIGLLVGRGPASAGNMARTRRRTQPDSSVLPCLSADCLPIVARLWPDCGRGMLRELSY